MLNFGHFSFAAPWLLAFFAVLPALWWLLRLMPPAPKKVVFPALSLLLGLVGREETPARSPWWLLALRLLFASLLIIAFARPVIDPKPASGNKGALLIAIDNDWASARDWDTRREILHAMLRDAAHDGRDILLLATTEDANGEALSVKGPMAAESAAAIDLLHPEPWAADWTQASSVLQNTGIEASSVAWLASGLGSVDAKMFYENLKKIAPVKIFGNDTPIYTLAPPVNEGSTLSIAVQRAGAEKSARIAVNAVAKDGNILGHWMAEFSEGSPRVAVTPDLLPELRNRVARFEIEPLRTAASTVLLDAAWQHVTVGIVGDKSELDRHSLLSELFYIDRALKPYADIRIDTLDALLKTDVPIIVLTDAVAVSGEELPQLAAWIRHGGTFVRFAGERFAAAGDRGDEAAILPVPLHGGRSLGGALTWGAPQKLQEFPAASPFHNLAIPLDVTVSRQILAEPSPELGAKTWAALADGTPLVTAATMGQGISILFHVPAQSSWSNLPISGLFVEMLQRILQLARSDHNTTAMATTLRPLSVLDAGGTEQAPGPTVLPIEAGEMASIAPSPRHPPGLYGAEADNVAFNLGPAIGQPQGLRDIPVETYSVKRKEIDLQSYILVAAFLLLLCDFLVSLSLRGFLRSAVIALAVFSFTHAARAADDKNAIEYTSTTYLAYVRTGDAAVDRTSELGLHGLALMLQKRTSIDQVGVAKVDPDRDDLAFFPLLYWPVVPGQHPLSPEGARRVSYYLNHGGMILFDAVEGDSAAPDFLKRILAGVDLPPLVRLPDNHVLKRTFYLLDDFPGRFAGHDFWLEPEEASAYDGVASALYGSNGWAAAWAIDENGQPLYPCSPDGEAQREHAFRFGVNLVIYALTGNYKNDQMQTSALLGKMRK